MTRRVDLRATGRFLGTIIKYVAAAMLVPLVVAVVYWEDGVFAATIFLAVGVGMALAHVDPNPELGPAEALLLVTVSWMTVSLIGAVSYLLATFGTESSLAHSVNALFESTSGFTTTGATIMNEIGTERYSRVLLIWRQLTQWLGGMGIIVLMVAILPELGVNGAQLIRTEAPGPEFQNSRHASPKPLASCGSCTLDSRPYLSFC